MRMPLSTSWSGWAERSVLVALLLVAYVWAWRPARAWLGTHLLHPVARSLDTDHARDHRVSGTPMGVRVVTPSGVSYGMRTPGGILFLLPILAFALTYPRRHYWLYFGLYVAALGALRFFLFLSGIAWTPLGFRLYSFLSGPVYMATTLGAPLIAYRLASRRQ